MMSQQDLTADMLTRIRNAIRNRSDDVRCLNNRLNRGVAKVLLEEGYINHFEITDNGRDGVLRVDLKYGPRGEEVIRSIDRVSWPVCRIYMRVGKLLSMLRFPCIAFVSTSKGVLSHRPCREEKVGGELVAIVS
jgi:small subunit ribosomal protein S8